MSSRHAVSRDEWIAARTAFLPKEKEFTRARGALDLTPLGRQQDRPGWHEFVHHGRYGR
jgi:predicted dithiol-disulfide oxidoreductase (DUF899 family)